jgi:hypothetical protein
LCRHQGTTTALDAAGSLFEVPLLVGEWKRHPNNPLRPDGTLHHYCPPEQVAPEMERLLSLHRGHARAGVAPEVQAAWLHHRFSQIHPFQDGNGRVARALASVVLLRAGWFPLVVDRDARNEYLATLETADAGDLAPLASFVGRAMKRAFVEALGISTTLVGGDGSVEQEIASAVDKLRRRRTLEAGPTDPLAARRRGLLDRATAGLARVAGELSRQLQAISLDQGARAESCADAPGGARAAALSRLAAGMGFTPADHRTPDFAVLVVDGEVPMRLVLACCPVGPPETGLDVVCAFAEFPPAPSPEVVCPEVFEFTVHEPQGALDSRLDQWLDDVVRRALAAWRARI